METHGNKLCEGPFTIGAEEILMSKIERLAIEMMKSRGTSNFDECWIKFFDAVRDVTIRIEKENAYRSVAREMYAMKSNDDIEIDDDADVSIDTPPPHDTEIGAWVEAWVWVPKEEYDKEPTN